MKNPISKISPTIPDRPEAPCEVAVILAGGSGTRLRPYTYVLPKPLIPVGSKPILGHLLNQLRRCGIPKAVLTLGYAGSLIKALCMEEFKDGIELEFSTEETPLGTIGPLRLIKDQLKSTFLVVNGDLLTDLDFKALIQNHRNSKASVTIACHNQDYVSKYGAVKTSKGRIVRFQEKPVHRQQVSMGVYVLEPEVLDHVPDGVPYGADQLFNDLLQKGIPINSYLHNDLWLDIGSIPDLQAANEIFEQHRHRIVGDSM